LLIAVGVIISGWGEWKEKTSVWNIETNEITLLHSYEIRMAQIRIPAM
jgi:hypothetical protein